MKVSSFAVARPTYWDRNATSNIQNGNTGAVGPHGEATRWTVTIAAGKKAFVDAASLDTCRYTVSSVAGLYYSAIRFTPSGGSACTILGHQALNNLVGSSVTLNLGGSLLALAGDALTAIDAFDSTGGTINFSQQMHYIVFDA